MARDYGKKYGSVNKEISKKTFSNALNKLGILLFITGCGAVHEGSRLESGNEGLVSAATVVSYENTLYPVIVQNCAECHGSGQPPTFAEADALASQEVLVDLNLISLSNPGGSRLVEKIQGGHQGFSPDLAIEIQAAIQTWSDQLIVLDTVNEDSAAVETAEL